MPTTTIKKPCKMLVRDNIPEIIETLGYKPVIRQLNIEEYANSLVEKIQDKTIEIACTLDQPLKLTEELSDLQELIDTIAEHYLLTKEDIARAQSNKRRERGGFSQRIFLEEVIKEET